MVSIGTSYFGTYSPEHIDKDLDDMASLFDWVVIPMSEELAAYQAPNLKYIVQGAKSRGMETYLGTWGVAGIFGGEGVSTVPKPCLMSCEVTNVMNRWLDVARYLEPTGIMWDEPKESPCACSLVYFLSYWIEKVDTFNSCKQWLYSPEEWWPEELDEGTRDLLQSFGMDFYLRYSDPVLNRHFNQEKLKQLETSKRGSLLETHAWVQAFSIKEPRVEEAVDTLAHALSAGLDRVGIWGYNGSSGMGVLKSDPLLWPRMVDVIREWKDGGIEEWTEETTLQSSESASSSLVYVDY